MTFARDDSGDAFDSDGLPFAVSKVIDLSHGVSEAMPHWPGDPETEFEGVSTFAEDGFRLRRFSVGEHSGTHMNAPCSFHEDGVGVDKYRPVDLIREAVVIDVWSSVADDPDFVFGLDDLERWEGEHVEVPAGSVVLLCTGWDERWASPQEFLGLDERGGLHFPGFGIDVTRFLLERRGIGGVGIDTHGVDPGQDGSFKVNSLILAEPRIVLENLANLDQLPATGATLLIAPLKLEGGTGSPVRVFGLIS